jgi:hypothetical protein
MGQIFVSPGVYTQEQDFSAYASRIGITKLGLVGLTDKGPAFQVVPIISTDQFAATFGATNVELPLPYVANSFLNQANQLNVVRILGAEGYTNSPAWVITALSSEASFVANPLCVLRSKKTSTYPSSNSFEYNNANDIILVAGAAGSNPLAQFVISGLTSSLSANPITVSLDETQANYIVKVIGKSPMRHDAANEYGLYVEAIYPHFTRQFGNSGTGLGLITGIASSFQFASSVDFTNYTGSYTHSTTPWVVSNKQGNSVKRLFRIHTIADGDSSASEIKISITNIDPVNFVFDLLVRNYNDTDYSAFSAAFERFRGCSLDPTVPNFIGNLIGTYDGTYPSRSNYIMVEMIEGIPTTVVPAGFEGYPLVTANTGLTTTTQMVYKSGYTRVDSVNKTFLGLSELAYSQLEPQYQNTINVMNSVKTLESDLFKFRGNITTGNTYTSLGFHMEDLSATSLSGTFASATATTMTAYTRSQAKFTFVPYGGFDGFVPYRTPTFVDADANFSYQTDYYNVIQLRAGIDLLANPEDVAINLFAMPGVDYGVSADSVRYALAMVEDRADCLYIMDAPRNSGEDCDIVVNDLQDTGIDSSYAATYWPWVQILDATLNRYVYIAPTAQVVQSIAYTDNVAYPWFAPAGFNRGLMNVVRAETKLSKSERDTLYAGRVNPIATFVQQGVVIFGQKTVQSRQTALDRVNVRRLLLQIRSVVAASSQTLLFEQNDTTLQDQFKAKVDPILLAIQNNRGLYAYKIIMDSTNNTPTTQDQNTLVGKIQLKPTKTAEFIDLTFEVLPTGANFADF